LRSPHEIYFRIRQEVANLRLFAFPPTLRSRSWEPQYLPPRQAVAATVRGTPFATEVEAIASLILNGTVPLLGFDFAIGARPAWRKDYVSGIESGTAYFRKLPYLDAARVGDHKIVWELNRHQHLALLAMAALLTDRRDFTDECAGQLESWFEDNPFLRGINWTSALEVAFRALSWIWILGWIGDRLPESLRDRMVTELYRHGLYLEYNLSVYFSPNTHLLGEAVVLHLLGRLFPDWPRSRAWERHGARVVEEQMDFQMQEDGVHFEQSTYYHGYAVDFFLLHRIFARNVTASYDAKLRLGIEYLRCVLGPGSEIPLIGDDDGGRLFHPYGDRTRFGRATMATASVLFREPSWLREAEDLDQQCVWWLGPQSPADQSPAPLHSRLFRSSGMAVLTSHDIRITFDAGPFGWAGAGHSHSDTLSLTVTVGEEEILIDAGTYTYVGEPAWRDWFRGSAAHNTIRLDGKDQARPSGPFRWLEKPVVGIESWESGDDHDAIVATCRYNSVTHRRRVIFDKSNRRVLVEDEVEGDTAEHRIEQFWHFGSPVSQAGAPVWKIGSRATLTVSDTLTSELTTAGEHGWRSRVLGRKEPAGVLRLHGSRARPVRTQTTLIL
jgi:hypothetical protein